ncbi:MAG: hypothetical protein ACFFAH_15725 [Promethearchaeota archaeon]
MSSIITNIKYFPKEIKETFFIYYLFRSAIQKIMVKIEIICPSCLKKKYVEISEDTLNVDNSRGIISINLKKNQICSHSFVAYIDRRYNLRDSLLIDFDLELPQIERVQNIEDYEIPDSDVLDLDLIREYINALSLTYIIRSFMLKKKLLILIDKEFLYNHLFHFLKFIFKNSFEIDINVEKSDVYNRIKRNFKGYIVLNNKRLVQDKNKTLVLKKIKIERIFIQKFLAENDNKLALLILKNEIQIAFEFAKELSKKILDLSQNRERKDISPKKIYKNLVKVSNVKLSLPYLNFLLEIAENYFEVEIPKVYKFFLLRL